MIIGIAGRAGAGKDTLADILVRERSFVKLSLADEIKRICKRVFDFSDEQLWGPSSARNAADQRYSRPDAYDPFATALHLTPRHALQLLGTEWGRRCYENVWIDLAIRTARAIGAGAEYTQRGGLQPIDLALAAGGGYSLEHARGRAVVIPDVRFENEAIAIEREGGRVIILSNTRAGAGLEGAAGAHVSELGIDCIGLRERAWPVINDGTIAEVRATVLRDYDAGVFG